MKDHPVRTSLLFLLASLIALLAAGCGGDTNGLVLGATTSVQDTGLLDEIVRAFEQESGYNVTPVVGGSGQILEMARRGELDVVLTHSPEDEEQFLDDGEGVDRRPVMENYFLIAGPKEDPAQVAGAPTLAEAFSRIASGGATFVSRGDNSGTHKRELAIWKAANVDPAGLPWYQESATGQGQNLLVANDKGAYTLVDSSTFIVFKEMIGLESFLTDFANPNVYSVTRVNPEKHPDVNTAAAVAFVEFMRSPLGQCLIYGFGRDKFGESLFSATCLTSSTGG